MLSSSFRFADALRQRGIAPPDDEEELDRRLDLVLVRNDSLLRRAYRRCRIDNVGTRQVAVPARIESDSALELSRLGSYGVLPPGLNRDELAFVKLCDESPHIRWWHRNLPLRDNESVALLRWDDGQRFFPDFVLGVGGRATRDGIALVEVKGPLLWREPTEVRKASAEHPEYGQVFMVGRKPEDGRLWRLRERDGALEPETPFDPGQLRW